MAIRKATTTLLYRASTAADLNAMAQIAADAKARMKAAGLDQWQKGTYPDRALFAEDIAAGIGRVVELREGTDAAALPEVVAFCALTDKPELSYESLTSGAWLTSGNSGYMALHRCATSENHLRKGIAGFLFASAIEEAQTAGAKSIRIDTHPDNHAMQRALEKTGFVRCGTLILADGAEAGDPRLAYEYVLTQY